MLRRALRRSEKRIRTTILQLKVLKVEEKKRKTWKELFDRALTLWEDGMLLLSDFLEKLGKEAHEVLMSAGEGLEMLRKELTRKLE